MSLAPLPHGLLRSLTTCGITCCERTWQAELRVLTLLPEDTGTITITRLFQALSLSPSQVLASGDHVVAAARQPGQAAVLQELMTQYGSALQLVALDVDDGAAVKARAPLRAVCSGGRFRRARFREPFPGSGVIVVALGCRGGRLCLVPYRAMWMHHLGQGDTDVMRSMLLI